MSPPCPAIEAEFRATFSNATTFPRNWEGERAMYAFCMASVGASLAYCWGFMVLSSYHRDYLKHRSFTLMVASVAGPVLQFHVGGFSIVQESQLPCWFQGFAPMIVVPLTVMPMMVRIIVFKATYILALAAAKGIALESDMNSSVAGATTTPSSSTPSPSLLGELWDQIKFTTWVVVRPRPPEQTLDPHQLRRWKFLGSPRGLVLMSVLITLPTLILALCVFIDPVYRTSCPGCALRFHFVVVLILMSLVSVMYFNWHGYQMRGALDPFNIVKESLWAARLGGIPALVSYIVYAALPASAIQDVGMTTNMMVALGFLVMALTQTVVQVWIAQYRDAQELAATMLTRKERQLVMTASSPRHVHVGAVSPSAAAAAAAAPANTTASPEALAPNGPPSPLSDRRLGRGGGPNNIRGSAFSSGNGSRRNLFRVKRYNYHAIMEQVFARPLLHEALEKLLVAEHSPESLAFLDAVQAFKLQYFETSERGNAARARRIMQTYIGHEATFQVNISSEQVDHIHHVFDSALSTSSKVPYELFDEAREDVFQLVMFGPVVRLVKGRVWARLISEGVVTDEEFLVVPSGGGGTTAMAVRSSS